MSGEGKHGSVHGDNEAQMQFIIASTDSPPLVLLDFRRQCDHLHLTPREARDMADGLHEAANAASGGAPSILRVKPLNGS